MRGIELSADDLVRRAMIQALMCHFELSHRIDRDRLSARLRELLPPELEDLKLYQAEGLIDIDADWIGVTPSGRLLIRTICMVFDRYLRAGEDRARYSKVDIGIRQLREGKGPPSGGLYLVKRPVGPLQGTSETGLSGRLALLLGWPIFPISAAPRVAPCIPESHRRARVGINQSFLSSGFPAGRTGRARLPRWWRPRIAGPWLDRAPLPA